MTEPAAAPPLPGLWARASAGERLALEQLTHRFCYPAYAWIRACGVSADDAALHCRDFLSRFVTASLPIPDDPHAARFREYVLMKLKASLVQGWPSWDGPAFLDFDPTEAEQRFATEPAKVEDEVFARCWSLQILELTLRSLEREYREADQAELFVAMKPFLAFRSEENGYAEAAAPLGISAAAFHVQVFEFRQRYRAHLRKIVGDTTLHADEVDSELTVLLVGAS